MNDWLQYHNPNVMDYGIDDVPGPPFTIVSDKVIFPCDGVRIWLLGRRAAIDPEIYLGGWMIVEGIRASSHPKFLYEYYGESGLLCDPMPGISGALWYPDVLKLTGNFRFGLTEIKRSSTSKGLRELAG
jgi:hypothetical protein